jgi:hypothetical protein
MAIIRDASGFVAICGIWRNSSRSIEPEPSLRMCPSAERCRADGAGEQDAPVELHEALLEPLELSLRD